MRLRAAQKSARGVLEQVEVAVVDVRANHSGLVSAVYELDQGTEGGPVNDRLELTPGNGVVQILPWREHASAVLWAGLGRGDRALDRGSRNTLAGVRCVVTRHPAGCRRRTSGNGREPVAHPAFHAREMTGTSSGSEPLARRFGPTGPFQSDGRLIMWVRCAESLEFRGF